MDAFICTLQKNREDTLKQIAELESQATLTEKRKETSDKSEKKKLMQILSVWKGLINMPGKKYEATINQSYYLSSKFATAVASASLNSGFRMGTRQMLGAYSCRDLVRTEGNESRILSGSNGTHSVPANVCPK